MTTDERRAALRDLLRRIGLPVRDDVLPLLELAFTHRSWRMENGGADDNERLEFLGDAVIEHSATLYLYRTRPEEPEGVLSKIRAALVSRKVLGILAKDLDIGPFLYLGAGEEQTGGRARSSNLGSALEAICGACSLVYPWEELCPALEEHLVVPALAIIDGDTHEDFKSQLQEWSQRRMQCVPEYELLEASGPDHEREFTIRVRINGELFGVGSGRRKKTAENEAARQALQRIETDDRATGVP